MRVKQDPVSSITVLAVILFTLLISERVFSQEIPEPVRDTSYDWRCIGADGVVVSNHTRQDKATVSCQRVAMANPGTTYYIEAGRYRVIVGPIIEPPPPIDPPTDPPPPVIPPIDPPTDPPPPETYLPAMYSLSGDLSDPKELNEATLARVPVYIFTPDHPDILKIRYYCCKGGSEPHLPSQDEVFVVDISTLYGEGQRELYYDITMADGSMVFNNFVHFNIVEAFPPEPPVPSFVDITVEWTIPIERENGDALPVSELAGYNVKYWKNSAPNDITTIWVPPGSAVSFDIDHLEAGIAWSFQVNAQDIKGLVSEWSPIITEVL